MGSAGVPPACVQCSIAGRSILVKAVTVNCDGDEMAITWTCGFCDRAQIATDQNDAVGSQRLLIGKVQNRDLRLAIGSRRCLNEECGKLSLQIELQGGVVDRNGNFGSSLPIRYWNLLPDSSSKPQPDFIPKPLRDDYYEACLIRDKSPKASATLSRRCLQGMVRDFCGISKSTLDGELKALRKQVDDGISPREVSTESVDAIDKVRAIGNIGAHMQKDINVIIEVEEDEAQLLIDLIEMLFAEWYVARHKRQERLQRLTETAAQKQEARQGPVAQVQALPSPNT